MRAPRVRPSLKGMVIDMTCGAFLALLFFLAYREGGPRAAEESRLAAGLVTVTTLLAGVAGAVLSSQSWAMFAGGAVVAIVFGIWGVLGSHHLKGLIYSIFGAPIGAVFVYLYGVSRGVGDALNKLLAAPAAAGVRDGELDW